MGLDRKQCKDPICTDMFETRFRLFETRFTGNLFEQKSPTLDPNTAWPHKRRSDPQWRYPHANSNEEVPHVGRQEFSGLSAIIRQNQSGRAKTAGEWKVKLWEFTLYFTLLIFTLL